MHVQGCCRLDMLLLLELFSVTGVTLSDTNSTACSFCVSIVVVYLVALILWSRREGEERGRDGRYTNEGVEEGRRRPARRQG